MNMQIRTAFALLMIVAASVAQTVEGELDQARSLAQANKIAEAGKAVGRAAAIAHKASDVFPGTLDLSGHAGRAGNTSYLPHGTPLYRLAKGETWSVNKQGIVSITSN